MSLKVKIASIISALVIVVSVAGALIHYSVFSSTFELLEEEEVIEDLDEITRAFDAEIRDLERITRWYVASTTGPPLSTSAAAPRLGGVIAQELDLLLFCDASGSATHKIVLDPDDHTPITLEEFPNRLSLRHPALAWAASTLDPQGMKSSGLLATSKGPMCLAAAAYPLNDGFVVAGRFVFDTVRDRIAEDTGNLFDLWQIDGPRTMPQDVSQRLDQITSATAPVLDAQGESDQIAAYATINDILERPSIVLRANVVRRISSAGSTAMASGALLDATMGFIVLLCLILVLNHLVLRPIQELTEHAEKTGSSEDFHARLNTARDDEFGMLGRGFDQMMIRLEKARGDLLETARTAGKSELATGILHNVGNVLNSVNISAALVGQRLDELCIRDLERLAAVLTEHAEDLPTFLTSDPRGKHIEPFLAALVKQLREERGSIRDEVQSLSDGIEHICELIKSQQGIAKKTSLREFTNLADRFDEALMITQKAQGESSQLVVIKRYEQLPEIEIDKHRLLEILVNLIQNARQATSGPSQEVLLELRKSADGMLALSVADNGCGIAKEDLIRIFSMGYTTRDDGHGFGLHSCANVAKEMGGSLRVQSDGVGRGACFTLEVPERPPGSLETVTDSASVRRGGAA